MIFLFFLFILNVIQKFKMKLGISYNVFDGEELLEKSIRQIREHVDYISVIYQKHSNYGNPVTPECLETLQKLYDEKLIDVLHEYGPTLKNGAHWNEIMKRNVGLYYSKVNGCTHHMSMDTDEFYVTEQFAEMKKIVEKGNYDSSACQMSTYFKYPTHRIDPKEDYYVSLIYRIRNGVDFVFGHPFPVLVDPTRRMNPGKCKIFTRDEIEMHHMSYVRKDIASKVNNSSAKVNFSSVIPEFIDRFNNWKEGEKGILLGLPPREYDLVKVENIFDI